MKNWLTINISPMLRPQGTKHVYKSFTDRLFSVTSFMTLLPCTPTLWNSEDIPRHVLLLLMSKGDHYYLQQIGKQASNFQFTLSSFLVGSYFTALGLEIKRWPRSHSTSSLFCSFWIGPLTVSFNTFLDYSSTNLSKIKFTLRKKNPILIQKGHLPYFPSS